MTKENNFERTIYMKLGIVGLPNVGKSTLFNAITKAGAEAANYPFCTIEPNVGVVAVPDERLDKLSDMYHPKKYTPAIVEFVDIAGLVKGASRGEGLGNKFLSHIREVDSIVQVVRCFEDANVVHVTHKKAILFQYLLSKVVKMVIRRMVPLLLKNVVSLLTFQNGFLKIVFNVINVHWFAHMLLFVQLL